MADDVKWLGSPEAHDYDAALNVLLLDHNHRDAEEIVSRLEADPTIHWFAAKDILRRSGEPHLPKSNKHVAHNLRKIEKGEHLSPILLVAGRRDKGVPLLIADGYHRVCAVHHFDEDALIPAKLAH
jgi:hypothetical protein